MNTAGSASSSRQLGALIALRWRMIRSRPTRIAIAALCILPLVFIAAGFASLYVIPKEQALNVALATPTLYLGFLILAVLAPLVSGGGYELYPGEQLVSFPVRAATVFRGTLVLAPVNLAWILNVIGLFVVTAYAAGPLKWGPTCRASAIVFAYILVASAFGHVAGWFVMGVRQTRRGRIVTNLLGLLLLALGLYVIWADLVIDLLDKSPTRSILDSAYHGYNSHYYEWTKSLGLLTVGFFACVLIGDRVAAWALRRPGDHSDRTSSRHVARRRHATSALSVLIATDHASLWRSVPLRRGVLVLVIVPGLVAALAGMSWQSLVLVPGLIAAGAGLLFGINAFALDYTGAVWLATLPQWPKYAFVSKAVVFAEVTLGAVVSALVGGSLRSDAPDRPAEVVAAITSALCCAAIVVALGMRSSLRHPHRAALSGPRDTPATPGVMAAQSVKFALLSTLTALFFGALALSTSWWIPAVASIPILVACWLHLSATARAWQHPHVRANVVTTVSAG